MFIRCSWCGQSLGEKAPLGDNSVSHGQCPECQSKMEEEFNDYQRDHPGYFGNAFDPSSHSNPDAVNRICGPDRAVKGEQNDNRGNTLRYKMDNC